MEGMKLIALFRARGWGLLLPLIALQYAALTTQPAVIVIELAGACLLTAFRPRVAA
jgi:hypothetical protein